MENRFEPCRILDFQADNKSGFYFVNVMTEKDHINKVISVNPSKPEKSSVIFELSFPEHECIVSMIYNPKNETFYFFVNNGHSNEYDIQTHEDSGIYRVKKSADGRFTKNNLHRYFRLQDWIVKNVCDSFLTLPPEPDYDGFLNYFFKLADTNITPIFCITDENGNILTNKDAVKYLMTSGKIKDFPKQYDKFYNFAINKYLFVADKDGKPTLEGAVSYCKNNKYFSERFDFSINDAYFCLYDDEVYFAMDYGSIRDDNTWHLDWSEIFKIYDDSEDFYFTKPELLTRIHTLKFKSYDYFYHQVTLPLENSDYGLVLNDIDRKTVWLYNGNSIQRFNDKNEFIEFVKECDDNLLKSRRKLFKIKTFNLSVMSILILSFVILIFVAGTVFLIVQIFFQKQNARKLISRVQQAERRKISYDIHDSIVQDIRAIRIGAEMLEVSKESAVKKENLIESITKCIVKMRDICYGLSPAELFETDENGLANIYTILQTLAEQFFRRTNIQCTISTVDENHSFCFNAEDCSTIMCIVQEVFKNIEKHSFATSVHIFCRHEIINGKDYMQLFIIDDGKGCSIDEILSSKNQKNHFGLRMIQERVKMIKGSFVEFCSSPNDGMQIKLSLCGVYQKKDEK